MKKTYIVFGPELASYDTFALGLYAIKSFPTHEEAEKWVSEELEQFGKVRSFIDGKLKAQHEIVLIIPQYEKAF